MRLSETGLDGEIEPRLAFEISRGCWWGEKHHCAFCGLNGESTAFRRTSRPDVHRDILDLVTELQVLRSRASHIPGSPTSAPATPT